MAMLRSLVLTACIVLAISETQASDVSRFAGGRGHLASQVSGADWLGMRLGDELPPSSRLRTSPIGSVRINLPAGSLCLARETDVELDSTSRKLVLEHGRLLIRNSSDNATWTVTSGAISFECTPGCEVEITYAETIGANILKGEVEVTGSKGATKQQRLTSPLEWICDNEGNSKSTTPTEENWTSNIRRRTEPRDAQGLGQLLTKDAQSDNPVRLEVARYHVNVVLQPPVALVQIDQSFFNPYNRQEEGTFVFDLPEGASVSRFAMFVTHDQLIEGELIDRKRADQVYTSIVRSKRDPAILEQIGTNLFRMRVFPIFANDTKRILLDYTIPLVAEHGRYRFNLPLMSNLKPIWDFGITGTIHPPFVAESFSSHTHPNLEFIKSADGSVTFSKNEENSKPPTNLLLEFRGAVKSQPVVRTNTIDGKNQHFVITVPDSARPMAIGNSSPMDVLLLVDTSGSANYLAQSRIAAKTLVGGLRSEDRWQMGCTDVSFRPMTSEWLLPRSHASQLALRQLDNVFPLGESRLNSSIEESLQVFANSPEDRRRVIVYIGDGDPTGMQQSCWQNQSFRHENPRLTQFSAIKCGDETDAGPWLTRGTLQTNGRIFRFHEGPSMLRDIFEWTLTGMPAAAAIESLRIDRLSAQDPLDQSRYIDQVAAEDLFYDRSWPRGRDLHVYGRCKLGNTLTMKLKVSDSPERNYQLEADSVIRDEDIFTGRMWAQNKIASLFAVTTNHDETARAEIVKLCQEWSLMSPYTAFLVLETEQDYSRWNISRQLRHRYWKPAGNVEATPLFEMLKQQAIRRTTQDPKRAQMPKITPHQSEKDVRHLDAAKIALENGNAALALIHLNSVPRDPNRVDLKVLDALMSETRKQLDREVATSELKHWHTLVDRRAGDPLPAFQPLMMGLCRHGVNPEYLDRHPQAMRLRKPAPEFREEEISIVEFANKIQTELGIPVILDRFALSDEGISIDHKLRLAGLRFAPMQTLLDLALSDLNLAWVSGRHCCRITTATKADEMFISHVYSVVDLVRSDVLPLPSRLANPSLDFANLERKRLESLLSQPVTTQFQDDSLTDVLESIFEQLGEAKYRIDIQALSDEGISTDQSVTLTGGKLPADIVLEEILSPINLEYIIRDGIIVVTTQTKGDECLETRVYSAAGIVNEKAPRTAMNGWMGRGIGSGMGGWMGGGFGGGGMGGGGGFFGGGGGVGGGVVIGGGVENADGRKPAISEVNPPQFDESELDSSPSESQEPPISLESPQSQQSNLYFRDFNDRVSHGYDDVTPTRVVLQSTPGKWQDQDGDGGTMVFHPQSFSFVVRQTSKVHAEIKELFSKLRKQSPAARVRSSVIAHQNRLNEVRRPDYQSLMRLVMQANPGKWQDQDGDGGNISPHSLSTSLVISQTEQVHESIEQLFSQLRRARYIAESLPWMTTLDGIDELDMYFDRPTLTDLRRNSLDANLNESVKKDDLQQLAVRITTDVMNQRWVSTAAATNQRRAMTLRRKNARLEIVLPDRTLRAEGPRAAVAYPGLTLVEIDAWGDSVRQVADSSFPWLPHRSNEEVLRLFDVTFDSEDGLTKTIRFNFPGLADTYLKATYSKQTGAPTQWQSILSGKMQYELRFDPNTVVAVDPSGKELERWERIAEEAETSIPAIDQSWDDFVIVVPTQSDSPIAKVREAIRRGDDDVAIETLARSLALRPKQPFLNFLYAWSIEARTPREAKFSRLQRESLIQLAKSGSADLLRLVTPLSFPSIGIDSLREILLAVPEQQRTDDLWNRLSELSIQRNRYDLALSEIERSIAVTQDNDARIRRQISRVELLLYGARPIEANASARDLLVIGATPTQMLELGDFFSQFNQPEMADFFFERYLQIPAITKHELCQVAYRRAAWLEKGERRWRLLLAADEDQPEAQRQNVGIVIAEADHVEDAEILGKLATEVAVGPVQTHLLARQADLTENVRQAADIKLKLHNERRISTTHLKWVVQSLEQAGRNQETVELLEKELRQQGTLEEKLIQSLANAYLALGRPVDHLRATTQATERPLTPVDKPKHRVNPNNVGSGFFNIP